jgi:hypothetical protein
MISDWGAEQERRRAREREHAAELAPRVGEELAKLLAGVTTPATGGGYTLEGIFELIATTSKSGGDIERAAIDALVDIFTPFDMDTLHRIDIPRKWETWSQERAEKIREQRKSELRGRYGSLDAFNRQTGDLAAQLGGTQRTQRVTWGTGSCILCAVGESLMIEAGIRIGKTTLAGLLVRARIFGGDLLGYPVRKLEPGQRVLYLALDRPEQIKASLLRQFTAEQLAVLPDHLEIWEGKLPADAAEEPEVLCDVARHYKGIAVVVLDSLKDCAVGLSDERVAQRYNEARQALLATGRQLVELHHLTKAGGTYGNTFLHAGAGSVLRLSGKPAGKSATLTHVLPVADIVGPLKLALDHGRGEIELKAPKSRRGCR